MGVLVETRDLLLDRDEINVDEHNIIMAKIFRGEFSGPQAVAYHKAALLASKEGRLLPGVIPTFEAHCEEYPNDVCLRSLHLPLAGAFLRDLFSMQRHYNLKLRTFVSADSPITLPILKYLGPPRLNDKPEVLFSAPLPTSEYLRAPIEDWTWEGSSFKSTKPGVDRILSWWSYGDDQIAEINRRRKLFDELLDLVQEYRTRWPLQWTIPPEVVQKLKATKAYVDGTWQEVFSDPRMSIINTNAGVIGSF